MKAINETIWNRKFALPVEFDVYEGEEMLPNQEKALQEILSTWEVVNDSLDDVKAYCLKSDPEQGKYINASDIFEYVLPKELFIKHDAENRIVALLCDYKFNLEDGIAIVFENEHLKQVGPQYCIL